MQKTGRTNGIFHLAPFGWLAFSCSNVCCIADRRFTTCSAIVALIPFFTTFSA